MIKKISKKIRKAGAAITTCFITIFTKTTALASGFSDSKLATGTEALISDLTKWLMILAPVVTVLLVIYYLIRKSAADDMESKKWNNRIVVALVCCVGAVLASAIVNLLVGYYQ
jgi:phosphoglycerol transferase MdoB-like AlkP superfamily enzyme